MAKTSCLIQSGRGKGIEPSSNGFGDRDARHYTTPLIIQNICNPCESGLSWRPEPIRVGIWVEIRGEAIPVQESRKFCYDTITAYNDWLWMPDEEAGISAIDSGTLRCHRHVVTLSFLSSWYFCLWQEAYSLWGIIHCK